MSGSPFIIYCLPLYMLRTTLPGRGRNVMTTVIIRDRKSRPSIGVMWACGAVGEVDVGLRDAQVDILNYTQIHNSID